MWGVVVVVFVFVVVVGVIVVVACVLRCFTLLRNRKFLATPPFQNIAEDESGGSFITSIILHDDLVPRVSPTSIRRLVKHLLYVKETWVDKNLMSDVGAVANRVKNVWAPRWRSSFVVKGGISAQGRSTEAEASKGQVLPDHQAMSKYPTLSGDGDDGCGGGCGGSNSSSNPSNNNTNSSGLRAGTPPALLENSLKQSTILEQSLFDESQFYEAEENLIDSDSDESDGLFPDGEGSFSSLGSLDVGREANEIDEQTRVRRESAPVIVPDQEAVPESAAAPHHPSPSSPVFLAETPLPRMYIPGDIYHIYMHNGTYKASKVPRRFKVSLLW